MFKNPVLNKFFDRAVQRLVKVYANFVNLHSSRVWERRLAGTNFPKPYSRTFADVGTVIRPFSTVLTDLCSGSLFFHQLVERVRGVRDEQGPDPIAQLDHPVVLLVVGGLGGRRKHREGGGGRRGGTAAAPSIRPPSLSLLSLTASPPRPSTTKPPPAPRAMAAASVRDPSSLPSFLPPSLT